MGARPLRSCYVFDFSFFYNVSKTLWTGSSSTGSVPLTGSTGSDSDRFEFQVPGWVPLFPEIGGMPATDVSLWNEAVAYEKFKGQTAIVQLKDRLARCV